MYSLKPTALFTLSLLGAFTSARPHSKNLESRAWLNTNTLWVLLSDGTQAGCINDQARWVSKVEDCAELSFKPGPAGMYGLDSAEGNCGPDKHFYQLVCDIPDFQYGFINDFQGNKTDMQYVANANDKSHFFWTPRFPENKDGQPIHLNGTKSETKIILKPGHRKI